MLAKDHANHEIGLPSLVQPKLDGIRLLACLDGTSNGQRVVLSTRTGKRASERAFGALGALLQPLLRPGLTLDGEMYLHGRPFEELASLFKREQPELKFHVFDVFDAAKPGLTAQERLAILKNLKLPGPRVVHVPTVTVRTQADLKHAIQKFTYDEKYEGIMLRKPDGLYQPGKRSDNLLKMKPFQTDEFKIVDVVEAEGRDAGTAVFVCAVSTATFNVRMKATREARRQYWQAFLNRPASIIGKMLTVRYQELTRYGIPRFPVGLAIRDYE